MVEGQRFELWEGSHPRRFSRPMLSTAQPTLQYGAQYIDTVLGVKHFFNGVLTLLAQPLIYLLILVQHLGCKPRHLYSL